MRGKMADLKIGKIVLGVCQTNCYFVYVEGTDKALVFDPADRGNYIYDTLSEKGFQVAAILLTQKRLKSKERNGDFNG